MSKSRARDDAIGYAWLISGICSIILFIGLIMLLSGVLTLTDLNGDFVAYDAVPCTVVAVKAVPASVGFYTRYMGVASVQLNWSSQFRFAAIRQAETLKRATWYTTEAALGALEVSEGQLTTCGVPNDGEPAALYATASEWPFDRPAIVRFDRESSQAQLDYKDNLILAGAVFVGVGGGVILLVLLLFAICRCSDSCGDCDCGCCSDSYEQYMLERRINSSGGKPDAAQQSADFTEDGLLTHYTCAYGPGACFSLFLAKLCGSSSTKRQQPSHDDSVAAAEANNKPQE